MSKSTAIATLNRKQTEVYNSMNKAWQAKADRALHIMRNLISRSIWDHYELGEIVRELAGEEPKYGTQAVVKLAELLGEHKNVLWDCKLLATVYPKEKLTKLLGLAEERGSAMTVSHIYLLCDIKGKNAEKIRKSTESLIIAHNYSVADLQTHLQQLQGRRSKHKGPSFALPKSPLAGLGQINKVATEYEKRYPGWESVVFDFYEKAGVDQLSEDHLKELENSRAQLLALSGRAQQAVKRFDGMLSRVRRVIANGTNTVEAVSHKTTSVVPADKATVKRKRPNTKAQLAPPKKKAVKKAAARPLKKKKLAPLHS